MTSLNGTNGSDTIVGTNFADTIRGRRGADLLVGGAGDDDLFGGRGNDQLNGGIGNDRLFGGNGSDYLVGDSDELTSSSLRIYNSPAPSPGNDFFEVLGKSLAGTSDGGSLQVWQYGPTGKLYAQIISANGTPVSLPIEIASGYEPAISMLAGNQYAVTYQIGGATYAVVLDSTGHPISEPTVANTGTNFHSTWQNLSALSDGGFAVVFGSDTGSDGSSYGVYLQYYDNLGQVTGENVLVNSFVGGSQKYATVATLLGGNVVVVWASEDQDGSGYGIYSRILDANGTFVSAEMAVNTILTGNQTFPEVVSLDEGGYFVVWASAAAEIETYNIVGQRFAEDGTLIGAEVVFNSNPVQGSLNSADIAQTNDGTLVATWHSVTDNNGNSDVYASTYSLQGVHTVTNEFLVNSNTLGNQYKPSVTATANGGFSISWNSTGDGTGADGIDIKIFSPVAGNDYLNGGNGDDILEGQRGNDTLVGGLGRDVFVFGNSHGNDLILDFQLGFDLIDLSATDFDSSVDVLLASTTSSVGAVISWEGGTITLSGVQVGAITDSMFIF
jgi:Ca2+-binding RTX toxin-like protein